MNLSDGDFQLFFFATQPFLKVNYKGKRLCALDGIVANDDYRALDTEGNIIGGLYVTGNVSGCNYMGSYPKPRCRHLLGTLRRERHAYGQGAGGDVGDVPRSCDWSPHGMEIDVGSHQRHGSESQQEGRQAAEGEAR